jgi:hypothetical protein
MCRNNSGELYSPSEKGLSAKDKFLCQLKDLDELKYELTEEIRQTRFETMEELIQMTIYGGTTIPRSARAGLAIWPSLESAREISVRKAERGERDGRAGGCR